MFEAMNQDCPFVSPNNSEDEDGVTKIREKGEAECAVAKTLIGMGQGLPKDDDSMKVEGEEGRESS